MPVLLPSSIVHQTLGATHIYQEELNYFIPTFILEVNNQVNRCYLAKRGYSHRDVIRVNGRIVLVKYFMSIVIIYHVLFIDTGYYSGLTGDLIRLLVVWEWMDLISQT